MNKKEKFEVFLESLKGQENDALIESVKAGFRACYEGKMYDVFIPKDPNKYSWDKKRKQDKKIKREFIKDLNSIDKKLITTYKKLHHFDMEDIDNMPNFEKRVKALKKIQAADEREKIRRAALTPLERHRTRPGLTGGLMYPEKGLQIQGD